MFMISIYKVFLLALNLVLLFCNEKSEGAFLGVNTYTLAYYIGCLQLVNKCVNIHMESVLLEYFWKIMHVK